MSINVFSALAKYGSSEEENYLTESFIFLLRLLNVRLVLLTRSRASANETTLAPADYHHVCWYEIYNWLADISHSDEVSQYFINAFMNFLEDKNMNLKKVTWEYMQGIESLLNLTTMMETAAKEIMPEMTFRRTAGWNWRGFSLDGAYFFGLRFDHPSLIVFENNQGTNPTAKCELDLEVTHFFALTKDEQFELLVNFLKRAKAEVPKGNTALELSDNDSADI